MSFNAPVAINIAAIDITGATGWASFDRPIEVTAQYIYAYRVKVLS